MLMANKRNLLFRAKPLGDVDKQNRVDLKVEVERLPAREPFPGTLSESEINLISFAVQEGNHDPDKVRALPSKVKEKWQKHKDHALLVERQRRDGDATDGSGRWSEEELQLIRSSWRCDECTPGRRWP